jgi:DNA-directed RNA polymerase specialized sigma24 family protein
VTAEAEFRQLLAEMSLLQYGRTQAFNPAGGHSDNPDPRPSGEAHPLVDKWLDQWDRYPTRDTLDAARAELHAWKVRTAPAEGDGSSEDDWILRDGEGFSAEQVARKFNVTATRVRRVRVRNDRDAEYGKEVQALVPSASKEQRVVLLTERGLSSREVAAQVDLHKTQVLRILARHRNAA